MTRVLPPPRRTAGAAVVCTLLCAIVALGGCDDASMSHQPKDNAYTSNATGPGPRPHGVVEFHDTPAPPPPLSLALIERGKDRFEHFCTPCHSELGDGHGMIVQRGFSPPPSYHIARLRQALPQHFFDVITNGYGAMYSFAQRVPPADRWAIAAYIRALQRSTVGTTADLSPAQLAALQ